MEKKKKGPIKKRRTNVATTRNLPPPAPKGNQRAKGCTTSGRPREWTDELIEAERIAFEEWLENPNSYFIGEFIVQRKLTGYEMLQKFAERSPEFSETLKKARAAQEQRIVQGSMTKKFDGSFAKFVLANKAGWREKQEISGDAANPLAVILDRIGKSNKDPLDE